MQRRTQIAAFEGSALSWPRGLGTGAVVAGGNGDDDASETAIAGAAEPKTEEAALKAIGEGTVTGTEVDNEECKYVEVTLVDGSTVDVQLDEILSVVGTDDDGADDLVGADVDAREGLTPPAPNDRRSRMTDLARAG